MKQPHIGLKIRDCYMSGVGGLDNIGDSGVVEHVGIDYMIVRNTERNEPIIVMEPQYYNLDELQNEDFDDED